MNQLRTLETPPIMIRRRDGSVTPFKNAAFIPAFYLIPEAILERCGQELYTLPRCFFDLMNDWDAIKTVESDLFLLCIIDSYAYMVWPYLCPDIPYMEIYSGFDPIWRLAHSPGIWIRAIEDLGFLPKLKDLHYNRDPNLIFNFIPPEGLNYILSLAVPYAVEMNNLDLIMETVKEMRTFEDFDERKSKRKIDFYRKWYHTRAKKGEISLEGYQEQMQELYDDIEWEVPDPVSSFEDEVVENIDVQRFLSTLSEKDKIILQLRQDGYTLQEIADKLGYKTHSAVLKRIKSIGRKYEKHSGLRFGFQRMT